MDNNSDFKNQGVINDAEGAVDGTSYEPNFVIQGEIKPESSRPRRESHTQVDPREAFRPSNNYSTSSENNGAGYSGNGYTGYSSGNSEGENLYSNPSYRAPETGEQGTSSSASWSGGVHRCKKSKCASDESTRSRSTSPTVSLTKKSLALLVCCCLILSGLFGLGGSYLGNVIWNDSGSASTSSNSSSSSSSVTTTGYDLQSATGSNLTVQEITEKTQSSIVEIKTESVSNDNWMQQYVTEGAGSGIIISEDGYIMTNNHVIEGASKITITTSDEKTYEAEVIGADETNDIAVLKINASGLSAVTYGNSDELNVGDLAVAIGNPLGELGGTVTAGIISATDRELSIDGKTMTLLQTDSSINPGNSGGGLFNGDGQLIGVVVAKSSGSDVEGLGFAIPINTAADIAQQLMDNGYVAGQPWTGMSYTEGSSGYDSLFGNGSSTVYIYSVESSTAKRAGFQSGDVVFAIDGTQISSADDITSIVSSHEVGDKLTFTIVRDGQTKDISIKLQEKTSDDSSN